MNNIVVVGSGNAALCAGIAALEKGSDVTIFEIANENEWGGNSRYTAGAMRFAYNSIEDIRPLLLHPADVKLQITDFGSYSKEKFIADLQYFNEGVPVTDLQKYLVENSLETLQWLGSHNIKFAPIYSRQSFMKDGKYVFWGGLSLEAEGEGDGLVHEELKEFKRLGGIIHFGAGITKISMESNKISGISYLQNNQEHTLKTDAVILACGGFESNKELREKYLGANWGKAKVRGTRHNMGHGLKMATDCGAALNGYFGGCHATPMDFNMPEYGNLEIPHIERKHYRKISYLYGLMLNENGERFVDEGFDLRNYTYAQFGKAVLEQPNQRAWQIFDAKVWDILYSEYKTQDASHEIANTIEELIEELEGIDKKHALKTIQEFNEAVEETYAFDPTIKDGKSTKNLKLNKTNWANKIDTPPFRAFPVTCGITFTYGGVKINTNSEVLNEHNEHVKGLFACGEIAGGIFFYGYPGGSGLTSGAVFGRNAGYSASKYISELK
jgi:tricarballylate dehydrogenase